MTVDETGAVLLSRYERRPVPESATLTWSAGDVAVDNDDLIAQLESELQGKVSWDILR